MEEDAGLGGPPVLPEDVLNIAIPGSIRKAGNFCRWLKRYGFANSHLKYTCIGCWSTVRAVSVFNRRFRKVPSLSCGTFRTGFVSTDGHCDLPGNVSSQGTELNSKFYRWQASKMAFVEHIPLFDAYLF